MTAIDFQKINSLKSKNSFEDILISAKKKPSKEYMNDNTKLFKINSGKTARQHINMPDFRGGFLGYQLKTGQSEVKPFVVSWSNHERLNRPPFD